MPQSPASPCATPPLQSVATTIAAVALLEEARIAVTAGKFRAASEA